MAAAQSHMNSRSSLDSYNKSNSNAQNNILAMTTSGAGSSLSISATAAKSNLKKALLHDLRNGNSNSELKREINRVTYENQQ